MKYRQQPEDFIVEEIAEHNIQKKGPFKLYTLEKQGVETLTLLNFLSRDNGIPLHKINIAGIKDTHAKTTQYLTIPKDFSLKKANGAILSFLGYVEHPIQLGDLIANKFIITVKEITEEDLEFVLRNGKYMDEGLPNYFDSQRFGSVIDGEFIGKYLVKKEYETAVKIYLTSVYSNDNDQLIEDKNITFDSWPKFDERVKSPEIRRVLNQFNKTNNWLRTFKAISKPLRLMFISAYQSHIWNECVKLLLINKVDDFELYDVPYVLGNLVFNKVELANFPQTFQTMSHRIQPEEHEKNILQEVLNTEGVSKEQFNIRQTGNFFKSRHRDVMLYPTEFKMREPKKTDGTYSVTIEFTIPKSSYATMVMKSIFGK